MKDNKVFKIVCWEYFQDGSCKPCDIPPAFRSNWEMKSFRFSTPDKAAAFFVESAAGRVNLRPAEWSENRAWESEDFPDLVFSIDWDDLDPEAPTYIFGIEKEG